MAGVLGEKRPKTYGRWRQSLVESMAWGIERALLVTLHQHYSRDHLEAVDARFRAAMARGEVASLELATSLATFAAQDAAAAAPPEPVARRAPTLRLVIANPKPMPKAPARVRPADDLRFKRRRRPLPPLVPLRRIERAA
jgi:hypothetical protein